MKARRNCLIPGMAAVSCSIVVLILLYSRNSSYSTPPHPKPIISSAEKYINNESSTFVVRPRSNTYVLTFSYSGGQQGAAVHAIASLLCFLSSMGLTFTIAEPSPTRKGSWGYNKVTTQLKFRDLFDLEQFNSQSKQYEMVNRQDFMKKKSRHTILVIVGGDQISSRVLWSAGNKECIREVPVMRTKLDRTIMMLIASIQNTCIVRVVRLAMSKEIRFVRKEPHSIHKLIFQNWSPRDVTLIFNMWKASYMVPLNTSKGKECEQQHSTTNYKSIFLPSKKLLRDTKNYKEMFLRNESKLAIMLRTERVLKNYLKSPNISEELDSLKECLQEVVKLSKKLESQNNVSWPLVTIDLGKFGTTSFKKRGIEILKGMGESTMKALYRNNWSLESWESSFTQATGGYDNPGYIAALQRTLASRADCLILMGGGNFQAMAIRDYFDYHKETEHECIHLVCAMVDRKKDTLDLNVLVNELAKQ